MRPKPLAIANVRYYKANPAGLEQLAEVARYFQHRDGSVRREEFLKVKDTVNIDLGEAMQGLNDTARNVKGMKWVDRGLGEHHKDVVQTCRDWSGRSVAARTWVIAPDPELLQHVPSELHFDIIRRVTDQTMQEWYANNGWGTPAYSYIVHDKHRSQDGLRMPHSHVVTPGTISLGKHGRMDHITKKPHMRDLVSTTSQVFETELERVLGRDKAQEIIQERNERLDQERRERWKKKLHDQKVQKRIGHRLDQRGIDASSLSFEDWQLLQQSAEADITKDAKKRRLRERMSKGREVMDVFQLLEAEKETRDKKRQERRLKYARMTIAARHWSQKDEERRERDRLRQQAIRVQEGEVRQRYRDSVYESDLDYARELEAIRQQKVQDSGRYIPTARERAERAANQEKGAAWQEVYYSQRAYEVEQAYYDRIVEEGKQMTKHRRGKYGRDR